MGTIAAIVDWSGKAELPKLLSSLLEGGPGATQIRAGDEAAVGATGKTGIVESDDLAIAWDARIDNRPELETALRPLLGDGWSGSDGELIAYAYHNWGRDCPARLIGDFAFVLWDRQRRGLLAARDGMNMRTLSYLTTPTGIAVASTGEQLSRHPASGNSFSSLGLAGWISGWPDPDISLFEGVEVLPPGCQLWVDAGGVDISLFWDIDPSKQIRYRTITDYQEHLHELMHRAVSDRMRTEAGVIGTQMSGGMDSTSVTALARDVAAQTNRRLLVISHSYRSVPNCDESERIQETLRHLNLSDTRTLAAEQHAQLDFRELYPPVLESPGTVLSPRYRDEMQLLQAAGADVLLTGSGGDEMTWGHSLSYLQRLKRGDFGVVPEVVRGCRQMDLPVWRTLRQLFIAPLQPTWVRRLRGQPSAAGRLPDWIPQAAVRRLDLNERLLGRSKTHFDNPALQARYEALRRTSTFNSVHSYAQVGSLYGVEVRHPFFDIRLAEFSFAIPDDLWIREGYPKWLLRGTMAQKLPASVCWNRHKVIFDDFFGRVIRNQAETVRGILADRRLEEMGLLDTDRLLSQFDRVVAGQQGFSVDLLYALMTQVWVARFMAG